MSPARHTTHNPRHGLGSRLGWREISTGGTTPMPDSARAESGARADWRACTTHAFLLDHCSVYSFSSSCPKTVSRTREVFPTGSTTLLRLQLSRTRDCAHRSRHVGFFFFFFFLLERKVPAQSKLKE